MGNPSASVSDTDPPLQQNERVQPQRSVSPGPAPQCIIFLGCNSVRRQRTQLSHTIFFFFFFAFSRNTCQNQEQKRQPSFIDYRFLRSKKKTFFIFFIDLLILKKNQYLFLQDTNKDEIIFFIYIRMHIIYSQYSFANTF